mmetsp:Transcript_6821/g.13007  ORF Transcript_6821/g.13007 Transcript_6821/m.13007 type:complete len:243 (-) Transcript_6821:51-779(-)
MAPFIQPLDSFCCGLQLDWGIKVILFFNICTSIFYIVTTVLNIVFDLDVFNNNTSVSMQTLNCGFALASIPFIIAGISGLKFEIEVHLRLYLYYLQTSFVFDTFCVGANFLKSACKTLPAFLAQEGGSFACGTVRSMALVTMLGMMVISGYCVFVVWSRCEEMALCGSEPAFDTLISETRLAEKAKHQNHEFKTGLFGTGGRVHAPLPVVPGSLESPPFAGSAPIFGGRYHEMNYPPPVQCH